MLARGAAGVSSSTLSGNVLRPGAASMLTAASSRADSLRGALTGLETRGGPAVRCGCAAAAGALTAFTVVVTERRNASSSTEALAFCGSADAADLVSATGSADVASAVALVSTDVADFSGELPPVLARAITEHWFDPCELLRSDARSELRPEHRRRQHGGGWEHVDGDAD